jgi:hypothetical protein
MGDERRDPRKVANPDTESRRTEVRSQFADSVLKPSGDGCRSFDRT